MNQRRPHSKSHPESRSYSLCSRSTPPPHSPFLSRLRPASLPSFRAVMAPRTGRFSRNAYSKKSHFMIIHWNTIIFFTALSLVYMSLRTPTVQRDTLSAQYAERVRTAMRTNFNAYTQCLGRDEYEPMSGRCHDWCGLGISVLDSIDTLVLMGLDAEYAIAKKWAHMLDISANKQHSSMFEIVIRALGGLNAAYALTGDGIWREKAIDLGDALLHAFETKTGCPSPDVELNGEGSSSAGITTSVAEAGTLQLEFRTLSVISGDTRYAAVADRCENALLSSMPNNSLIPMYFDPDVGTYVSESITIGAPVDSFVEMLLKTWIAFGKHDYALRTAFENSVEHVFAQTANTVNGTLLLGTAERLEDGSTRAPSKTMEHLACFFPGVLALGALHGLGGGLNGVAETDYIPRAKNLTRTCFLMSRSNPYGLAPEVIEMNTGMMKPKKWKAFSLLRPEIVEALYIMHTVTGDQVYRQWGRMMWDSMERNGTLDNGRMASTFGLDRKNAWHSEKLHSFVLAETLKYFFLLFREPGDGPPLKLTEWVFNTEAHPVRVRNSR